MVETRTLGYKGVDPATVAAIMDAAEYLPTILLHGENKEEEFLSQLRYLASKFPQFTHTADEYESAMATNAQSQKREVA